MPTKLDPSEAPEMMLNDLSVGAPSWVAIFDMLLASGRSLSLASGNNWFHTRTALSTSSTSGAG